MRSQLLLLLVLFWRTGSEKGQTLPEISLWPRTTEDRDVQAEIGGRFHLSLFPRRQDCSLSITDARKADSGRYFLEVAIGKSRKHSYLDFKVYVNVTARHLCSPNPGGWASCDPELHISWGLYGGDTPHLLLERGSPFLQDPDSEPASSSEISLTPMPRVHGSSLTCRATFARGHVSTDLTCPVSAESRGPRRE
ncbi:sialic acid-binding Ig-like lectin 9 [Phascolarctos cinereus]|uniref:Sialic acid-binding Ig-like lectin 9 isoform X2 n=1 Tax=Phascolarctos cinereus TaxID=38626 RepID=A0A6P5LT47_PHACI|nr:sialic acid-binding Ig-like lectin 9 isoform X2 [Phascolarctos cinereus]